MDKIEDEIIEVFKNSLTFIEGFDARALVTAIYNMVEQHKEACHVLIFKGASQSILNRMIDLARDTSISTWKKQFKNASHTELEMLYTHLSSGLLSIVLHGYDKYSQDEILSFVSRIFNNSLLILK